MPQNRTQQMIYYEDALPAIFHHTPRQFLSFLERDGNQFLAFYWNQVGKNLGFPDVTSTFGLNYQLRKPNSQTTIAIVSLPTPQIHGEAFLSGFIFRARGFSPTFMLSSFTTVFSLVAVFEGDRLTGTRVVEKTRKGLRIDHGAGPEPRVEEFYLYLLNQLQIPTHV